MGAAELSEASYQIFWCDIWSNIMAKFACKYCVQWMLANGILERFPQPKTHWPYQQIKAHSEIFLGSRLQAFSLPALPPSETPKVHVLRTAAKEPRLRSRTARTAITCTPRENFGGQTHEADRWLKSATKEIRPCRTRLELPLCFFEVSETFNLNCKYQKRSWSTQIRCKFLV